MNARGFKQQQFYLWMEIVVPGEALPVGLDVTRFSAQFALNTIPQATCGIALGASVPNTNLASNLHFIIQKVTYRTKATVYMIVRDGYVDIPPGAVINNDANFDGKTFVIFEGFTSGAGYKRSGNSVEYVISLEHWLSDLMGSTALSPDLMPGTPFNLLFPATGNDKGMSKLIQEWLDPNEEALAILEIQGDLTQAILNWFAAVANTNPIGSKSDNTLNLGEVPELDGAFTSAKNTAALAALNKFVVPGGPYYVPMTLKSNLNTGDTAQNIYDSIRDYSLRTFDGTTFWDNLITFGSNLMFNVVPGITSAWLAPKLPNYRHPAIVLYSTEVDSFNISTGMPRFLGGVVLKSATGDDGSGTMNVNNDGPVKAPAAVLGLFTTGQYFSAKHKTTPGLVMVQQSPNWLARSMIESVEDDVPGDVVPLEKQDKDVDGKIAAKAQVKFDAGVAFAKLVYANEVLKYRGGSVNGKFRTDIAPGTIVKIETAGENVIGGDGFSYPLVAMVEQVSLGVDSISGQAYTAFSVSNVRTEIENNDVDLTMEESPLYNNVWNGARLYTGV